MMSGWKTIWVAQRHYNRGGHHVTTFQHMWVNALKVLHAPLSLSVTLLFPYQTDFPIISHQNIRSKSVKRNHDNFFSSTPFIDWVAHYWSVPPLSVVDSLFRLDHRWFRICSAKFLANELMIYAQSIGLAWTSVLNSSIFMVQTRFELQSLQSMAKANLRALDMHRSFAI